MLINSYDNNEKYDRQHELHLRFPSLFSCTSWIFIFSVYPPFKVMVALNFYKQMRYDNIKGSAAFKIVC